MSEKYFENTSAISNSQLRTFARYNKYGQRQLYPDDYLAMYVDKTVKFNPTDAVIIWKIVDKFFDWTWTEVWKQYIPVAKRTWKEIKATKERLKEDKDIEFIFDRQSDTALDIEYTAQFAEQTKETEGLVWKWKTKKEASSNLIDQYVDKNYLEITMKMKEDAEEMINRWLAFKRFSNFLQHDKTEAQVELEEELELTDPITWELRKVKVKWLPDFVNKELNLIVDLKTTWSIDMVIDSLQFRGEPKLTANYIRQLSIYNKLSGGGYDWVLAILTPDGVKWIFIPNQILEDAWPMLEWDILLLDSFLQDPDSIDDTIFVTLNEELSIDDLAL